MISDRRRCLLYLVSFREDDWNRERGASSSRRSEYVYATVLRRNYAKFRGNGISSIPIERTRIRGSVSLSRKPRRGTWQRRRLREWSVVKFASGWRSRLSWPEIAWTKLRIRCYSVKANDRPKTLFRMKRERSIFTAVLLFISLCLMLSRTLSSMILFRISVLSYWWLLQSRLL